MFRIFAASVRRIALGFYETGLLTLPHFFFFFYAFSTRFDCFPVRYTTEKKFESDRREYISREFFLLRFWKNFCPEEDLRIANDTWQFVPIVNQQSALTFICEFITNDT